MLTWLLKFCPPRAGPSPAQSRRQTPRRPRRWSRSPAGRVDCVEPAGARVGHERGRLVGQQQWRVVARARATATRCCRPPDGSPFDIATVVDALRRIVDGETMIDPTIVAHMLGTAPAGRPARRPQPSENERSWG